MILTEEEHEVLGELTSKGEHKSQKIIDALILLRYKVIFFKKSNFVWEWLKVPRKK